MGKHFDFIISQPEKKEDLGPTILNRLISARIRSGFQIFFFIAGGETTGTGQGKSYFVLRWLDHYLASLGLDFMDYFNDIIVFTPLEFKEKMENMLNDSRLNKIHVLMLDEVSEVLDATEWQDYVTRAIRRINVKARGVKNLAVFFLSPDVHDLEKGSRRMLTFYGECTRPLGGPTKVILERCYKIRDGLENVNYGTRQIKGIVTRPGQPSRFLFPKFRIQMPRKELRDRYDALQKEKKGAMLANDFRELEAHLKKKYGASYDRVNAIVAQFVSHPEFQPIFFKWRKSKGENKIYLQPNFKKQYDLTEDEEREFILRFSEKMKQIRRVETEVIKPEGKHGNDEDVAALAKPGEG